MANCGMCGKKMGLLENQYSEFQDDAGVCIQCHNTLKTVIYPDIVNMVNEGQSDEAIMGSIKSKHASLVGNVIYLEKYIEHILIKLRGIDPDEEKRARLYELQQKADSMKITSGYTYEGYKINEYIGMISGETVIGTGLFSEFLASIDDLYGMESNSFSGKMRKVKENALIKLKMHAATVGANAIIGVDFDYITFSSNMIGVSANGTAVVIEKV